MELEADSNKLHCPRCNYDLRHRPSGHCCPECGLSAEHIIAIRQKRERMLQVRATAAGLATIFIAMPLAQILVFVAMLLSRPLASTIWRGTIASAILLTIASGIMSCLWIGKKWAVLVIAYCIVISLLFFLLLHYLEGYA